MNQLVGGAEFADSDYSSLFGAALFNGENLDSSVVAAKPSPYVAFPPPPPTKTTTSQSQPQLQLLSHSTETPLSQLSTSAQAVQDDIDLLDDHLRSASSLLGLDETALELLDVDGLFSGVGDGVNVGVNSLIPSKEVLSATPSATTWGAASSLSSSSSSSTAVDLYDSAGNTAKSIPQINLYQRQPQQQLPDVSAILNSLTLPLPIEEQEALLQILKSQFPSTATPASSGPTSRGLITGVNIGSGGDGGSTSAQKSKETVDVDDLAFFGGMDQSL